MPTNIKRKGGLTDKRSGLSGTRKFLVKGTKSDGKPFFYPTWQNSKHAAQSDAELKYPRCKVTSVIEAKK